MADSRRHQDWDPHCKVYIGGLRSETNKYDIEDAFSEFGKVVNVWIAQRPPGFGFVLFEDARDAQDSVKALDGTKVCGFRVKVEMCRGENRERERRKRSTSRPRHGRQEERSRSRSYDKYNRREKKRGRNRTRSRS